MGPMSLEMARIGRAILLPVGSLLEGITSLKVSARETEHTVLDSANKVVEVFSHSEGLTDLLDVGLGHNGGEGDV